MEEGQGQKTEEALIEQSSPSVFVQPGLAVVVAIIFEITSYITQNH